MITRDIAPTTADQLRILEALRKAGFKKATWLNGVLVGYEKKDEARVLSIVSGGFDPPFPPKKAAPAKHKKGRGKQ